MCLGAMDLKDGTMKAVCNRTEARDDDHDDVIDDDDDDDDDVSRVST